jgi:hypothetical protein
MLKNKRGFELGWEFFFNLLFVVAIIITVTVWINSQSSGGAMKKQMLAKETCLLATQASSGTTIMIEHSKSFTIETQNGAIIVKDSQFDRGYEYPCYIQNNVQISRKDNITIIEIR